MNRWLFISLLLLSNCNGDATIDLDEEHSIHHRVVIHVEYFSARSLIRSSLGLGFGRSRPARSAPLQPDRHDLLDVSFGLAGLLSSSSGRDRSFLLGSLDGVELGSLSDGLALKVAGLLLGSLSDGLLLGFLLGLLGSGGLGRLTLLKISARSHAFLTVTDLGSLATKTSVGSLSILERLLEEVGV